MSLLFIMTSVLWDQSLGVTFCTGDVFLVPFTGTRVRASLISLRDTDQSITLRETLEGSEGILWMESGRLPEARNQLLRASEKRRPVQVKGTNATGPCGLVQCSGQQKDC